MDFNRGNELLNQLGRKSQHGRFTTQEWLQALPKDELLFLLKTVRSKQRVEWIVEEVDRRLSNMNIRAVARPITKGS